MADYTATNGREFTFDMNAITIKEYRELFDSNDLDNDDLIYAKAAGIDVSELQILGVEDYRRLVKAFFDKARGPLDNPNSVSAST